MAEDYEITEIDKGIDDILNLYKKEKLVCERNLIIEKLEDNSLTEQEKQTFEKKLNNIIIELSKIK